MGVRTVFATIVLLGATFALAQAQAKPDSRTFEDDNYHGLAREGTVDRAEEFQAEQGLLDEPMDPVLDEDLCAAVQLEFTIELRLPNGTGPDMLALKVPDAAGDAHVDFATHEKPANITVTQPDACVDFTVVGVAVTGEPAHRHLYQRYVVDP